MKDKIRTAQCGVAAFVAAAYTLGVPSLAFAEEKTGMAVILPDMLEFIPMLVAFIILWIVLAKFGWPVFDKMLQKRSDTIQADLQKAEDARIEGERTLAEYKQELDQAKMQAAQIIADAKQTGEAARADITAQAQREAAEMIDKARAAIETEKKVAVSQLQGSVADTSVAVVSKLFGSGLTDDEHRALIERYVNEAGSFDAS